MEECLFCNFVTGKQAVDLIYEDDDIVAFNDISPKAPHHILIIPRQHITTLNELEEDDTLLTGKLVQVAKKLASDLDIAQKGYRLLFNCNSEGGQAVYHIHLHLLGGRQMLWPPG